MAAGLNLVVMRPSLPSTLVFAAVLGIAAICYANYIPDLSQARAPELISGAPEFNRYARLVKMEGIAHGKGSMNSMSYGSFTFRYLNSPADAPPIHAEWVDFQYWDRTWPPQ